MKSSTKTFLLIALVIGALFYFSSFKTLSFIAPSDNHFLMVGGALSSSDPLAYLRPVPVASPAASVGPYTITTALQSDQTVFFGTDNCLPSGITDNAWAYGYAAITPPVQFIRLPDVVFTNSRGVATTCVVQQIIVAPGAGSYSGGRFYASSYAGLNHVYGGRETSSTYSTGCFDETTITKSGVTVYQDRNYTASTRVFSDGNITVLLHQGSYQLPSRGMCAQVSHSITYTVPSSAVNVTVAALPSSVASGSIVTAAVTIDNEWTYDLDADLTINFIVPTGLSNPSSQTMNQTVHLPKGKSTFNYNVPTVSSAQQIIVTPTMTFYASPSIFSNVNTQQSPFDHNVPTSSYTRVIVGSFSGASQTVQVAANNTVPSPITVSTPTFFNQIATFFNNILKAIGILQ